MRFGHLRVFNDIPLMSDRLRESEPAAVLRTVVAKHDFGVFIPPATRISQSLVTTVNPGLSFDT